MLGIVIQRSPDLIDAEIDAPVEIHKCLVAPEGLPDFLARDYLARALRQQDQKLEMLGLEFHQGTSLAQYAIRKIDFKGPEA